MKEYIPNIITAIVAAITGIIGYYTAKLSASSKDKTTTKDEFIELIKIYKDELTGLKASEEECLYRYEELKKEFEVLRANVTLIKASSAAVPMPMWVKDVNGVMLSLNDSYEDTFLKPIGKTRADYIGKKDSDVWGEEIAEVFRKNDDIAAMSPDPISVFENVDVGNGVFKKYNIIKYRNTIADMVVSIAGIALPKPKV